MKGRWPRFLHAFKSLCLLKSAGWRHIKCFWESRPNVCSLQPAGHNQFFEECFQLMGFRVVPFCPWCCPFFLPSRDIDERESSPKCIYQQWNVFHICRIDLSISGCTILPENNVSKEVCLLSVSQSIILSLPYRGRLLIWKGK